MYHINEKSVLVARPGQRRAISLIRKVSLPAPSYAVWRVVTWFVMLAGLNLVIIKFELNLIISLLLGFLVGLIAPYSVYVLRWVRHYYFAFALAAEKEHGNLLMLPAGCLAVLRERFDLPEGRRTTEILCWQIANNFELFAELEPAFTNYLESQDDEARLVRGQELWAKLDRLPQLGLN